MILSKLISIFILSHLQIYINFRTHLLTQQRFICQALFQMVEKLRGINHRLALKELSSGKAWWLKEELQENLGLWWD